MLSILEDTLSAEHWKYIRDMHGLVVLMKYLVERNSFDKRGSDSIRYLREGLDILDQSQLLKQLSIAHTIANRLRELLKQNDEIDLK